MVPALIDVYVRPTVAADGELDFQAMASRAREAGIDGLVLLGGALPVDVSGAATATEATGVRFFTGVELPTERGRVLCCPRQGDDTWYTACGWRELGEDRADGEPIYPAREVARSFNDRGGAVLLVLDGGVAVDAAAFDDGSGLSGVILAVPAQLEGSPATHPLASTALPFAGGSIGEVTEAGFGRVATLFAAPPASQAALVDALRSGRVWPVEIGDQVAVVAEPANEDVAAASDDPGSPVVAERAGRADRAGRGDRGARSDGPDGAERADQSAQSAQAKGPDKPTRGEERKGKKKDQRARLKEVERPGDNRGNRLDARMLHHQVYTPFDETQPDYDPIARLYGIDSRKSDRLRNLSDAELDRIAGNRARGSDPNVMALPDFTELRAEREHVGLLVATIEEPKERLSDSMAFRFALTHYADGRAPPPVRPNVRRKRRRRT
mgnify:CR=1 FL=1